MSIAERYRGPYYIGHVKGDGYFNGTCRGGPYDGQLMSWNEPTYGIVMSMSTAEHSAEELKTIFDRIHEYNHTRYVWRDSTWVWTK